MWTTLFTCLVLCAHLRHAAALGERFCERDNCYRILGLEQNATLHDVKKAYRNASLTLHPDKNPAAQAAEEFNKLATAYAVLGNNESRGSYDYALAHPREHMIAYYARYGSRAYAQMKIPAHYSITGLILTISFIQYLSRKMSHEKLMRRIRQSSKYKQRMKELLNERTLANTNGSPSKPRKSVQKPRQKGLSEVSPEELEELQMQVDSECNVQGGLGPAKVQDTLGYQMLMLPVSLYKKAQWELRWHWKYTVNKEPYDAEAKEYLTRKALKLSEPRWQALEDAQREDLLSKELWVKENCEAYLAHLKKTELNAEQKAMRKYYRKAGMPLRVPED
ncbi:g10819 [Coccomyxa viridis]|uniref:G10819 protein n=1 Tax=Coccomyxa viridis TaxID=1274662 RepID=A0ABP1G6A3_9CHLO